MNGHLQKLSVEELTSEELEAVLVHKWFLSEKTGKDVGFETALEDFFCRHAEDWRCRRIEEDVWEQREEILKHKWYLSERTGRDVGNTQAALDWVRLGYAAHWRNRTGPYQNRK